MACRCTTATPYRFSAVNTQGSHPWPRVEMCYGCVHIRSLGCRNSIIASAVREINLIRSCCCAAPHAAASSFNIIKVCFMYCNTWRSQMLNLNNAPVSASGNFLARTHTMCPERERTRIIRRAAVLKYIAARASGSS